MPSKWLENIKQNPKLAPTFHTHVNTSKIPPIDFSNVVMHELQLDDYNVQIKFQGLKRIMYSIPSKLKLFPNTRRHTLTTLTVTTYNLPSVSSSSFSCGLSSWLLEFGNLSPDSVISSFCTLFVLVEGSACDELIVFALSVSTFFRLLNLSSLLMLLSNLCSSVSVNESLLILLLLLLRWILHEYPKRPRRTFIILGSEKKV